MKLQQLSARALKALYAESAAKWLIARELYQNNCFTALPSEVDEQCRNMQRLDAKVAAIEEEIERRKIP